MPHYLATNSRNQYVQFIKTYCWKEDSCYNFIWCCCHYYTCQHYDINKRLLVYLTGNASSPDSLKGNHTDAWYCLNLIGIFLLVLASLLIFFGKRNGLRIELSNHFLNCKNFVRRKPFKIQEHNVFTHVLSDVQGVTSLAADWFCRWCKLACNSCD